jgi:hypothetical protein
VRARQDLGDGRQDNRVVWADEDADERDGNGAAYERGHEPDYELEREGGRRVDVDRPLFAEPLCQGDEEDAAQREAAKETRRGVAGRGTA